MVTKHVQRNDDNNRDDEIIGWYTTSWGVTFPITMGGIKRLPKIIFKVALLWIEMFLLLMAIVTLALWIDEGWEGVEDFYMHIWNALVCFWEALGYFWGGVKFIIKECKEYKGH